MITVDLLQVIIATAVLLLGFATMLIGLFSRFAEQLKGVDTKHDRIHEAMHQIVNQASANADNKFLRRDDYREDEGRRQAEWRHMSDSMAKFLDRAEAVSKEGSGRVEHAVAELATEMRHEFVVMREKFAGLDARTGILEATGRLAQMPGLRGDKT